MLKTLFYVYKPGEERAYSLVNPPTKAWADLLHAAGFKILEYTLDVPDEGVADARLPPGAVSGVREFKGEF